MTPGIDGDPNWWRDAVVYQIYPRSFADADGDGIGDLRGVVDHVDHLASLGIDAVWLSPFYPSALADGGYDVDDYRDVDPRLGTLADFDKMLSALHAAGIRVIVDIVPNHSSARHPWFREALAAEPGSVARGRYIFRDGRGADGAEPPSDWISNFGGSAWERVSDGQWYLHLFTVEQPDFDWDNEEVREDFRRTLRFWSDRGVDGFRVDVAHGLAKDLSEPFRSKVTDLFAVPDDGSDPLYDRDEVHAIFEDWRGVLNEYDPPRAGIAEAWVPAARRSLYARPTELGQAFNFDLLQAAWDADGFRRIIDANLQEAALTGGSSTWVLSNHDRIRHPSRYALESVADGDAWLLSGGAAPPRDDARGLRRARAATMLILGLPGSAYLYQGEELGLPEVADLDASVLQDPIWERTGHSQKGRDGCRVPLPWAPAGPSLGFGPAGSHLPQPEWFASLAVSTQSGDPASTLSFYRAAIRERSRLRGPGVFEWHHDDHPDVLHFSRGSWHTIINFGEGTVPLPAGRVILMSDGRSTAADLPGETCAWVIDG